MRRIKISSLLQEKDLSVLLNKAFTLYGWIRTIRKQKSFAFIELNDGSCLKSLQIIVDEKCVDFSIIEELTTGASIQVDGKIVQSPGSNQSIEMQSEHIKLIGKCDAGSYPLQKKRHSFEFLRSIAHLRPRTNTQGAVSRVRNTLSFASQKFFKKRDSIILQRPLSLLQIVKEVVIYFV